MVAFISGPLVTGKHSSLEEWDLPDDCFSSVIAGAMVLKVRALDLQLQDPLEML